MVQRTFLVNGAAKGIGLAISKRLAAAGHDVVGIAREPLPSFPGTLASVDLNDDKASTEAFVELAQRDSFVGVVNNAGVGKLQRLARWIWKSSTNSFTSTCIRQLKRFLKEEQQDAQPGSGRFGRCLSRS
jgi:short-subunit dehydrogenase